MILPIVGYGNPVLRKKTQEIGPDYPELSQLIENMFETMYNAQGVGLAAPQIGLAIRLFVVDAGPMESFEEDEQEKEALKEFKRVFINPKIMGETGKAWNFEEGCLSIPDIREPVSRKSEIMIKYFDEQFEEKLEKFSGIRARVIQHEYDHLEGVLFTDHISRLRRNIIKTRLSKVSKGLISVGYPMKFLTRK